MSGERAPVGFAGLEALVSDVTLEVAAAAREQHRPAPVAFPEPTGGAAAGPRPVQTSTTGLSSGGPRLSTVLWVVGGVAAVVWVCSGVKPRSSSYRGAPTASSVSTPSARTAPVDNQASAGAPRSSPVREPSPASDVYTYTDEDGVVHFNNTKKDSRYRRVESNPKSKTGSGSLAGASSPSTPKLDRARAQVRAAAEKYRLPEALLLAVMAVESDYDYRALSADGRMGLMQLSPKVAKDMNVDDAWDPAQNIEGGARYLRVLANEFNGDPVQALAAYDAGPEVVRQAGGAVPNIPKTREFVRKVVELWKAFEASRSAKSASAAGASGPTPTASPFAARGTSAGLTETKPSVGEGRALSINEVRYCVFENERIERMKPQASNNTRIDKFNDFVRDYNSRCGKFRYRRGTLEQVRREAAERGDSFDSEARARF